MSCQIKQVQNPTSSNTLNSKIIATFVAQIIFVSAKHVKATSSWQICVIAESTYKNYSKQQNAKN